MSYVKFLTGSEQPEMLPYRETHWTAYCLLALGAENITPFSAIKLVILKLEAFGI
jgi:hypothetical protein